MAVVLCCRGREGALRADTVSNFVRGTFKDDQFSVEDCNGSFVAVVRRDSNCAYHVRIVYPHDEQSVFSIPFQFYRIVERIPPTAAKVDHFQCAVRSGFFYDRSNEGRDRRVPMVERRGIFTRDGGLPGDRLSSIVSYVEDVMEPAWQLRRVKENFLVRDASRYRRVVPLLRNFGVYVFCVVLFRDW